MAPPKSIPNNEFPEKYRPFIPESKEMTEQNRLRILFALMRFEEATEATPGTVDTHTLVDAIDVLDVKVAELHHRTNAILDIVQATLESVNIIGGAVSALLDQTPAPGTPPASEGETATTATAASNGLDDKIIELIDQFLDAQRIPSEFGDLRGKVRDKWVKKWSEPGATVPGRWQGVLIADLEDMLEKARRGQM